MPDRSTTAARRHHEDTAEDGYFAFLAQGKYVLLTTDRPKGAPVSVRVPGIVDGDRAYVRVRSRSDADKHLRQGKLVQVAACDGLGLVSYGMPRYATPRPVPAEDAERVAGQLSATYPSRWGFLHRGQDCYQLLVPYGPA